MNSDSSSMIGVRSASSKMPGSSPPSMPPGTAPTTGVGEAAGVGDGDGVSDATGAVEVDGDGDAAAAIERVRVGDVEWRQLLAAGRGVDDDARIRQRQRDELFAGTPSIERTRSRRAAPLRRSPA